MKNLFMTVLVFGFVQTAGADMLRCKVIKPCEHSKTLKLCAPAQFSVSTSLPKSSVNLYKMVRHADGSVKAVKKSVRVMQTKMNTHKHYRAIDQAAENMIDVAVLPNKSPNILVGKLIIDSDFGFNLVCNRAVTY